MKIMIIGGVAAGMSAAAKARRIAKDASITVYEKTDIVSWGACGLPYFVGDFFEDPSVMIARTPEQFAASGIDVFSEHEVLSVDFHEKKVLVKNLITEKIFTDSYDKLMIATGASATMPPVKNNQLKNIFTLKQFSDGIEMKKILLKSEIQNIVVVGAGYIGIEVIEAAKKLGKNVHLIEWSDRVLANSFDIEITDIMKKELLEHDVQLHFGEGVTGFEGSTYVTGVVTDKGSYPADLVVVATGIKPNTAFLKDSGLQMLQNGALLINQHGQTNIPDVYAAGDCASVYHLVLKEHVYIALATTANKIGRIAGENLCGLDTAFPGTLGSAAIKVMDLEAGRTGITENEAKKKGISYKAVFIADKNQTNYYPGQSDIFVKLICDAATHVILGGQIIGKKGAVLRVDVLAAAISSGMTAEQLGMLDLCYAPPFARAWDVLNVAANALK